MKPTTFLLPVLITVLCAAGCCASHQSRAYQAQAAETTGQRNATPKASVVDGPSGRFNLGAKELVLRAVADYHEGKLASAEEKLSAVIKIDRQNKAASYYLNLVHEAQLAGAQDFDGQVVDLNGEPPSQPPTGWNGISRDDFGLLRRYYHPGAFAKWSQRLQGLRPGMTRSQVRALLAPEPLPQPLQYILPQSSPGIGFSFGRGFGAYQHEEWYLDAAYSAGLTFTAWRPQADPDSAYLVDAVKSPATIYYKVH